MEKALSKIGALVAYKGRPAQVVSSTTHKYEISFSDGSRQKVREKDFRFIHPEFYQFIATVLRLILQF